MHNTLRFHLPPSIRSPQLPSTLSSAGSIDTLLNNKSGAAQKNQGVSLQSFLASLAVAAIVFGVQVVTFMLLRTKLRKVYEPRTYLVPEKRRTAPPAAGFFNWFKLIFNTATNDFISKSGLDAYFFLRYLLMLLKFFFGLSVVILPILLPINYWDGKGIEGNVKGLDQFAWSNVKANHTERYSAHLILAIVVVCFFCWMAYDELRKYIRLRQAYLTSPQHRLRASATTVLIRNIPKELLTVQMLQRLYDGFPGGIRNVWINRDYDELQEKVELRDKYARALEGAETELIRMANQKKYHIGRESTVGWGASRILPVNDLLELDAYPSYRNGVYARDEDEPVWKKYVPEKMRPTLRLPLISWLPALPFIGKKVDTITFCRNELARLNSEIEQDQENHEQKFAIVNSAFIQFNQQVAAHMACQSVSHHIPQLMTLRHIEMSPDDIIWGNMQMEWWERYVRRAGIIVATGGLVISWTIPVGAVGVISQVDYLTSKFSWLAWLDDIPQMVLGLISGVLPAVVLSTLTALLPIVLRLFARIEGCHSGMAAELSVQGMYFAFLFIQVFLVVSISSGVTVVYNDLKENPLQASSILADNLPKASNFFFSYLLLQAFSVGGGALMQITTLFKHYFLAPLMDRTGREKFNRATSLMEVKWGTFFPVYTNLACIGIIYSVISPLILIFNCITFSLFWLVYRYNLLFVINFKFDTGGLLFPRAINQLFTGIYVMETCLIGLFFLIRNSQGEVACSVHGTIMVVVTLLTALYQISLNWAFGPLYTYLPLTLEDDAAISDQKFHDEIHHRKPPAPDAGLGNSLNNTHAQLKHHEMESVPGSHLFYIWKTSPVAVQPGHLYFEAPCVPAPVPPSTWRLTPAERDVLVAKAFQHPALRAQRPVIWIPRDELGVSDDEIHRTMRYTDKVSMSNRYMKLDVEGQVVYCRCPPDLNERDSVDL